MVDDEKGRYRYVKVFGMVDRGIKKTSYKTNWLCM